MAIGLAPASSLAEARRLMEEAAMEIGGLLRPGDLAAARETFRLAREEGAAHRFEVGGGGLQAPS